MTDRSFDDIIAAEGIATSNRHRRDHGHGQDSAHRPLGMVGLWDGTDTLDTTDAALLGDQVVSTDKTDYYPGSTATISVTNASPGEIIEFQVSVISDPGADGLYGTSDDVLSSAAAPGSSPFYVTDGAGFTLAGSDGVLGTADDIVVYGATPSSNGTIQVTWNVDPYYADKTMLLTAEVVGVAPGGNTLAATGPTTSLVFSDSTEIDLTTKTSAVVNQGRFSTLQADLSTINGAGTGQIDPFDRISTTNPTEQGYNTDATVVVLDNANKGGSNFIHSLLQSAIPIVVINGVSYRQFFLDINQQNSSPLLSLDAFQVWRSADPALSNYDPGATPDQGTGSFPATAASLVYNLDSLGDVFVGLNYTLQPGSGNSVDLEVDVPNSAFGAGDPTKKYIYVYSAFGFQGSPWSNNDGFEEWVTAPATQISGHKFEDLNVNHVFDTGEPLLSGWTVYVDVNNNGTLDAGEPFTVTDSSGYWQFTVAPGTYTIREEQQPGWTQTAPTPIPEGDFNITVTFGQTSSNNDFGNVQEATKSGIKFNDLDGAGPGTTGPGLAGWTIEAFKDSDGNGILSQAEFTAGAATSAVTGAGGSYSLTLDPGTYIVVEVNQSGWFETTPSGSSYLVNDGVSSAISSYGFAITLTSGEVDSGNNFGNMQQRGRGALTPGFWCNHEWAWNGDNSDGPLKPNGQINTSQLKSLTNDAVLPNTSPTSFTLAAVDILYPVDSNGDGVINGSDTKGVLIGDLNHNGLTDKGEVTTFVDLNCAQLIVCGGAGGSQLISSDAREKFARMAIAAQLNLDNGAQAPAGLLTAAAEWLDGVAPFNSFTDGTSGNVVGSTITTPQGGTLGIAQCDPTTGAFTFGPNLSTNQDAWQQQVGTPPTSGSDLFGALADFNQSGETDSNGLIVSTGNLAASVSLTQDSVLKSTRNTLNAFLTVS
jgi:hypothetical protein